jgi:predicted nucleic acid-binding protein
VSAGAGVVDTNVVILLGALDAEQLPTTPLITTVTLAELAVGPLVARDDVERARRQEHLQFAERSFDPLPFDASAARAFASVAASLRSSGRKIEARSFDAMIAAIALANDLPLFTTDADDFAAITELTTVAVAKPTI